MRGQRTRVAERVRDLLGLPPAEAPRGFRWDPGRRGAAAVGVAVVVAVAVTLWWLMTAAPQAVPVTAASGSSVLLPSTSPGSSPASASGSSPGSPSTPDGSAAPTAALLVVDVAGKVRHPGIYRLPSGARVYDAIKAAGGARAGVDLVSLNLAASLQDGQQVVVGRAATAQSGPLSPLAPDATGAPGTPVNLNTASLEQLDTLPGVGPVLAQHILDWRAQHGQFTSVDQLQDVSGIGPAKLAAMHELVSV